MKTITNMIYPTFALCAFACFALLPAPNALGVVPAPDGGYSGFNTAEGQNALLHLTTGSANTAVGWFSLESITTSGFNTGIGAGTLVLNSGNQNTATGAAALLLNTIGANNTANGALALLNNTSGTNNTATGCFALQSNTTGFQNTAIGFNALVNNTGGSRNIAFGPGAGGALTTGDDNIDIGNPGVADESSTIRIGFSGPQLRTFIAAIRGVTTGNADAVNVVIDSNGQLGTMSSSRRFKKEIKEMDQTSEAILALKPVMFQYKSDSKGTPQFGLIAEEVAEVNPDLVVRDEKGEIYTVRYEAVNAMLLNEFLKEHRKNEEQGATIARLTETDKRQQKQIDALTTALQKVSAQVELNNSAPRTALNNQ